MRTFKHRLTAVLFGIPLVLFVAIEGYFQSFGFYREHYVIPLKKYGVLTPLRLQDIVFLVSFWIVAIALLYVSIRLLKYAFRS